MSKLQNDEPVLTGKALEQTLIGLITTILGFLFVRWLIIPTITWWQFLLTELVIMLLFKGGQLLLKKK